MKAWYDTAEGLTDRLEDGIAGFREIAEARHKAWYERQETLNEWVLMGRFSFDRCGNCSIGMREMAPSGDAAAVVQGRPSHGSWSIFCVPGASARCDGCGLGWTLSNLHDIEGSRETRRHTHCQRLHVVQSAYDDMLAIVYRAEIYVTGKQLIPSGYHPDDLYFGPWLRIDTPRGRIVIGRRKRVVHIQWPLSWNVPTEAFADEDVTRSANMIHAWTDDKAVEYLRTAWSHAHHDEGPS